MLNFCFKKCNSIVIIIGASVLGLIVLLAVAAVFFLWGPVPKTQTVSLELTAKEKRHAEQGIYITENVAQLPVRFKNIRDQAKAAGINTLVIDARRSLSRPLLDLLKEQKLNSSTKVEPDLWLAGLIQQLHAEGFIVTIRQVVFKDDHLALSRPDLAIKLPDGELYRDHKGGKWADPYSDEVRLYNELIAERAALSGADEVQFDYIRFPAEGAAQNAIYPFQKSEMNRVEIITAYLKAVKKRLSKYPVSIAVDIFGVTAWQSKNDIQNLGQDLKQMAKQIDVICPMFYPSHFHAGYDGYANPGSHPYYFVSTGIKRAKELLSGEAVAIVPWLQGFNLRSPGYGPGYIQEQIKACADQGVDDYLIWNARNDYAIPLER